MLTHSYAQGVTCAHAGYRADACKHPGCVQYTVMADVHTRADTSAHAWCVRYVVLRHVLTQPHMQGLSKEVIPSGSLYRIHQANNDAYAITVHAGVPCGTTSSATGVGDSLLHLYYSRVGDCRVALYDCHLPLDCTFTSLLLS